MDSLLNNSVAEAIFANAFTVSVVLVFVVVSIVIYFLYDIIYRDGEEGSHLRELMKIGIMGTVAATSVIYLYEKSQTTVFEHEGYKTLNYQEY